MGEKILKYMKILIFISILILINMVISILIFNNIKKYYNNMYILILSTVWVEDILKYVIYKKYNINIGYLYSTIFGIIEKFININIIFNILFNNMNTEIFINKYIFLIILICEILNQIFIHLIYMNIIYRYKLIYGILFHTIWDLIVVYMNDNILLNNIKINIFFYKYCHIYDNSLILRAIWVIIMMIIIFLYISYLIYINRKNK